MKLRLTRRKSRRHLEGQIDALQRIIFGTPGLLDFARRAAEERTEMKLALRDKEMRRHDEG